MHFHGTAEFNKVRFGGFVWFSHAHFHGSSAFSHTHFHGSSAFNDTHFHGSSAFKYTHFHGSNWFTHVNFCSTLTWIQGDEHESEIFFSTVRFKATKATVLEENAAGVLEEVVKNAVFSVDCPFDSQETTE